MRVLIVGARGMLGSDLMESFRGTAEVVGTDKEDFDITSLKDTLAALKEIKPQWVLNVAAHTQVDLCEEESELAFNVNAEGVKHLALACKEIQAKLLQVSTDYVFDGKKGAPYSEEDVPSPLSVYGLSKFKGESYLQELLDDFVIVRSGGLYGKRGVNFVNTLLSLARERNELSVVNDQWVAPTYTVDLSYAIRVLLSYSPRGIFHIANGGFCTWYQFACKIVSWMKGTTRVIPITTAQLDRPARRPAFSVLECRKFINLTGIQLRSWEEALEDYLSEVVPAGKFS